MSTSHTPLAYDPSLERAVLVVLPHPDDEAFSSGGTIATTTDAGVRVVYACGTYGDMGRRMGRPAFATRESLRDIREHELAEACAVLGAEMHLMGLRDKCVEFEDPHEIAGRIRTLIDDIEPSTVITFYPGYAVHPDHDALGWYTQLAVRGLPADARPRLLAVAVGDAEKNRADLGEPDVATDIQAISPRKIQALKAHRSQTEVMFRQWENEEATDEQTKAFRERMLTVERYYRLDPDFVTAYEQRRS